MTDFSEDKNLRGFGEIVNPTQMTTSTKAAASFGFALSSLVLTLFTGLPAVILGILSLRDIRQHSDRLKGRGLGLAGIGIGVVGMGGGVVLLLFVLQRVDEARERTHVQ
jgi:hypothetical protein